ncbi:HDR056Cp [Eremothecium sinecaudum]|uniref:HDR056Cp n=1 Tax=Eremothecium sinecaudum TaxID=45286 RepID=A0A0X8HSW3_9SACH|nr:HDR056Cp [Eremothecium sinecaudum]AMD20798.1 HDR056Cp [Eremothecium sinecaudum]
MDLIIANAFGEIQPVTRFYSLCIFACMIAHSNGCLSKLPNNIDLLIKKRNILGILLSIFNTGQGFDMYFLIHTVLQLSTIEKMVGDSKRFVWYILIIASLSITFSCFLKVGDSVIMVDLIKKNMTYYILKKHNFEQFPMIGLFAFMDMVFQNLHLAILVLQGHGLSLFVVSILPGFILYFIGEVLSKIYMKDFLVPPGQWFSVENEQ